VSPDAPDRAVTTPPLEPLREVVAVLERGGLRATLGGSGLLAALGLANDVRDWDLTVDAAAADVLPLLGGREATLCGSDALHADEKLTLDGGAIEIICRFAFFVPGGVVRLPVVERGRWQGVPLASPEVWAVAYALLERPTKADMLFGWLAREGAEDEVLQALLREPLPAALRARVLGLR
jgi:hypothetical protein